MPAFRIVLPVSLSIQLCIISSHTVGQDFPTRPIRILTTEAGGGSDLGARLIAQGLTVNLNQQNIVDNRAGGILAIETAIKAAPDGHTLLYYSSSIWILPLIQSMSYDALRDLAPVVLATSSPNLLVVHPSTPIRTVKDLIALAKARPGELNYATGATGSATHLPAELFKSMTGINIVRIPYKATNPALIDLIGGQVQMMFSTPGSAVQHVKTGRLRSVAVTSANPSTLIPGVPTVASSGLPGYEYTVMYGIFAPVKTPPALVERLNQEIMRVLNRPETKDGFLKTGVEVVGGTAAEFMATVRSDLARTSKVIKDAGIRVE
jgi:tripartite-type tricarboxylate transporter receptor subunit TctC